MGPGPEHVPPFAANSITAAVAGGESEGASAVGRPVPVDPPGGPSSTFCPSGRAAASKGCRYPGGPFLEEVRVGPREVGGRNGLPRVGLAASVREVADRHLEPCRVHLAEPRLR